MNLGLCEVFSSEVLPNIGFVIVITIEISGCKEPEVGTRNGGFGDI
jgi:hypothetical protein